MVLDQLISVCDEVRGVLDDRLRALDQARQPLPVLGPGTTASAFLNGLRAGTTEDQVREACTIATDTRERLAAQLIEEARLKATNPKAERLLADTQASGLEVLATVVERHEGLLGSNGIRETVVLTAAAADSRSAATIAAAANFDSEPLGGVGGEAWRQLWEAARTFSTTEAYHEHEFPFVGEGARCVLCHQDLGSDASDRFTRFQRFITDTTETDASAAEAALAIRRELIRGCVSLDATDASRLARLVAADANLGAALTAWFADSKVVATALDLAIDSATPEWPSGNVAGPRAELQTAALAARARSKGIDVSSVAEALRNASLARAELESQVALNESQGAVLTELARLKRHAVVDGARKQTDTAVITRKSSDLTREYVTKRVRDHFTRESEGLRLRRITLDDKSGVKGKLLHRPTLLGAAAPATITEVLSEGEQTALGLSGFFTEIEFDATESAVVVDDPVTSLDHGRRGLVAHRLVQLAGDRQVVVFTHDVSFVGDLVKAADNAHIDVAERWIQRNGDVLGICLEEHPWTARDVAKRLGLLDASLAAIKRGRASMDQDTYERSCSTWANDLSGTWERAVSVEIINEVVDRGTQEVRPKKFRILAAITQQDNDDFQAGYGRSSEWIRRHDKDASRNYVPPEPDELEAELFRLRAWFARIKGYRK